MSCLFHVLGASTFLGYWPLPWSSEPTGYHFLPLWPLLPSWPLLPLTCLPLSLWITSHLRTLKSCHVQSPLTREVTFSQVLGLELRPLGAIFQPRSTRFHSKVLPSNRKVTDDERYKGQQQQTSGKS